MLEVLLEVEGTHFDRCVVSIRNSSGPLVIFSTLQGSIFGKEISLKPNERSVSFVVEYPEDKNIECILSYYEGSELKGFESLPVPMEDIDPISSQPIDVVNFKIAANSFYDKLNKFMGALKNSSSKWEIDVSCPDDIVLDVKKSGENKILVSFGESSEQVLSSDFMFALSPMHNISIPKEIFWSKYDSYKNNSILGIFELVRPEFVATPNLYYKILISNLLPLSKFPKTTFGSSLYKSPIGSDLGSPLWKIGEVNLPVFGK